MPFKNALYPVLSAILAASFLVQCTDDKGLADDKKLNIYNVQVIKNVDTLLLRGMEDPPTCDTATCYRIIDGEGRDTLACLMKNCGDSKETITSLASVITLMDGDTINPPLSKPPDPIEKGDIEVAYFILPGSFAPSTIDTLRLTVAWRDEGGQEDSYTISLTQSCPEP